MQYEINYLVLQSKTAQLDEIRQEVKKLIESLGGAMEGEKNYLKRKLAYEIKHENYGFYTVLRFSLEKEAVENLKRELNLNNNVVRYIVVKTDELPSLEQAMAAQEAAQQEATVAAEEAPKDELEKIISQPKPIKVAKEKEPAAVAKETAEAPVAEEPTQEKEAPQEPSTPKEDQPKAEETKADKKVEKTESAKEDDKASLEELDKKLDEILNI